LQEKITNKHDQKGKKKIPVMMTMTKKEPSKMIIGKLKKHTTTRVKEKGIVVMVIEHPHKQLYALTVNNM